MGGIELQMHTVLRTPPVQITPPPATTDVKTDPQAVGRPAIQAAEQALAATQTHLELDHGSIQATLDYNKEYNQIIITLRQQDTGEMIQQFPLEKVLKLLSSFLDQQGGQVLDTKG